MYSPGLLGALYVLIIVREEFKKLVVHNLVNIYINMVYSMF